MGGFPHGPQAGKPKTMQGVCGHFGLAERPSGLGGASPRARAPDSAPAGAPSSAAQWPDIEGCETDLPSSRPPPSSASPSSASRPTIQSEPGKSSFCLELFGGLGRLTRACRKVGLPFADPVDIKGRLGVRFVSQKHTGLYFGPGPQWPITIRSSWDTMFGLEHSTSGYQEPRASTS